MKKIQSPKRSKMHIAVRDLLRELYPGFKVEEERQVTTNAGDLPIDLSVAKLMLCVECHGIQHFQHTPHFQKSLEDFKAQESRDRAKKAAILRAGYAYLCIRYDEYEKLTTVKLAKLVCKALQESQ